MIALYRLSALRLCLAALLTFGLLAIGLAHRAPLASDEAQVAYVLAGGDLSDLCGLPGEGSHGDCPACHLTGTAEVPSVGRLSHPANLAVAAAYTAPRENHALRPVLDPAHGLRAPPSA